MVGGGVDLVRHHGGIRFILITPQRNVRLLVAGKARLRIFHQFPFRPVRALGLHVARVTGMVIAKIITDDRHGGIRLRANRQDQRAAKQRKAKGKDFHIAMLGAALADRSQNIRHDLRLRLRALRAAVMETDAHRAGFHVTTADDQHRVNAGFFRISNFRLERR